MQENRNKMNRRERLFRISNHLRVSSNGCHFYQTSELKQNVIVPNVEVQAAPAGCENYHRILLNSASVAFIAHLVRQFDADVDKILNMRKAHKVELDVSGNLPDFPVNTQHIRKAEWYVSAVPHRLQCRHVDLGDVSPSNTEHFVAALQSTAEGIQTDFDDGHCPTWANQLKGLYNVWKVVHNKMPDVPPLSRCPVLMLRPRAWNMVENNMMVDGKAVPGPLFDFGLLMYHNAKLLIENESGPFFYLPKVEGYMEARLWNNIFVWTEKQLTIPPGTIKACVLIENILASFEMDEILYELKEHSAGLNCGIWDYSASFVNKFGHRKEFILPDRSKYVSMDRHFLKSYMDLLIQTCHRRNALATGGMAALLLTSGDSSNKQLIINKVCEAKLKEVQAGADGFMVFDLGLLKPTKALFEHFAQAPNQIHMKRPEVNVTAQDLLVMPSGGVTLDGLKHNIAVGILFVEAWLKGKGHYFYKGAVEDSATAEISRSQVWQWIRHQAQLEDASRAIITKDMVHQLIEEFVQTSCSSKFRHSSDSKNQLKTAAKLLEEIVTKRDFPQFITTYLYEEHAIRDHHGM